MPHAPDLAGHALDARYELHELIGEGTFGRVYRGRDRRLARWVAVKVIKPWFSEDPDWARRFEREAQALARVNDPGIVQIFDVGQAEEGIYYVAELVDGESLAERLRRGPLEPREACEVAIQLCSALAQAHAQALVHRDVKPANVLISANGRVKVGDFGVALLAEGSTDGTAGGILGTPRYMAPEQAEGRIPTPATDVYSVGVVVYEMLSGRPPFVGSSAVELALSHLHEPPPPLPPHVPTALQHVVLRALAKAPGERYEGAAEMADALKRSNSGQRGPSPRARPAQGGGSHTYPLTDPGAEQESRQDRTWVASPLSPRRDFDPPGRRRTLAVFALVGCIMLAMALGAILLVQPSSVRVPNLRGLSRGQAAARTAHAGLHAVFAERFSAAPRGTAVAQRPTGGAKVDQGSSVRVVLSKGPPPVKLPLLDGERYADAQKILSSLGLHTVVTAVPAPGVSPGTVTGQSPAAAAELAPGSTVRLSVAETPRWRPVTSFSGSGAGRSVPFRIRGTRWRIVYSMGYQGTCTFIIFCSGPSATVATLQGASRAGGFDLGEGQDQTQQFTSGAGVYQVSVTPGSDSAHWSMQIEDYY